MSKRKKACVVSFMDSLPSTPFSLSLKLSLSVYFGSECVPVGKTRNVHSSSRLVRVQEHADPRGII